METTRACVFHGKDDVRVEEVPRPIAGVSDTGELSPQDRLRLGVECARLAPTGHNRQAWFFRLGTDYADLFADTKLSLPVIDPDKRELAMSCGVALFYMRLALRYRGRRDVVEMHPDPLNPDWIARVHLGEPMDAGVEDARMYHAIRRRHTNRLPFFPGAVPEALPAELIAAARHEGGWLQIIGDKSVRAVVASLVKDGVHSQSRSATFHQEMDEWSPQMRKSDTDGFFHRSPEIRELLTHNGVMTTLNGGDLLAQKEQVFATQAALLVVIGTTGDVTADWVVAGQTLARVLLLAAASGINATYLNHPIQVSHLRPLLRDAIGMQAHPQLCLAMGYASAVIAAPRRRLEEIMRHE